MMGCTSIFVTAQRRTTQIGCTGKKVVHRALRRRSLNRDVSFSN